MKLDYHFAYLQYGHAALIEYVKGLGIPVFQVLEQGESVQQKTHWHTFFYQFETTHSVCLGIDSHPDTPWPVAEWYYVFWVPKSVFQAEWRRGLRRRRGEPFYFDYEKESNGEQLTMNFQL